MIFSDLDVEFYFFNQSSFILHGLLSFFCFAVGYSIGAMRRLDPRPSILRRHKIHGCHIAEKGCLCLPGCQGGISR